MKKLLSLTVCLAMILSVLAVGMISASATEAETVGESAAAETVETATEAADEFADTGAEPEIADVSSEEEIADTGAVNPVNLGDSFYARVRMVRYSDYFLTVPSKAADTDILRKLNGYNSQVWHFTRDGNAYRIRSVATNLYIEMNGSEVKEGAYLFHTTKRNAAEQKWIISKDATGYRIHSSVDDNYVMVCVNPTVSTSRVVLTTAVTNSRAYFSFDMLPINADLLDTPTLRLVNQVDSVLVDWNNVPNAAQYRVYRFNDTTKKWAKLADVEKSNYIDTDVKSGNTYKYTVKTISPVLSAYQEKSIQYIAAPKPMVNNTAKGPQIYWSKVAGAAKYRVFLHNGTGWKTLGTTDTNSFLHEKFEYNKAYRYTVRCLSEDGKVFTSAYDTEGVTNTILETPVVKASVMPFSCDLSWPKIAGAAKYKVYCKCKATDMKWTEVEDTAENTYSFADAVSNNGYYFTVRAMDENDRIVSGFRASNYVTFYEAPCVFDITPTSNTKKISWYPVVGASGYRVFAWNGQRWVKKGDTDAYTTVFSASIAGSDNQNVCYAVRCMNSDGKFISYYLETVIEGDLRYYYPGEYTSTHKF